MNCRKITTLILSLFTMLLCATKKPAQDYQIEFDEAMSLKTNTVQFKNKVLPQNQAQELLNFLRKLYVENHPAVLQKSKKELIPLKIHQIWLGPASPPAMFKSWQKSIMAFHPGWEYKLWTDKDIESLNLYNKTLYNASNNYGERSDIARYEILYQFGGVYLDIDFECIKSLKDFHYLYDFYTAIVPLDCCSSLANGIIGSVPRHPILRECITSLHSNWNLKTVLLRTGPQHFEKVFWKTAQIYNTKTIAFPASFFFPVTNTQAKILKNREEINKYIKSETIAIHHWTNTWTTKGAQARI